MYFSMIWWILVRKNAHCKLDCFASVGRGVNLFNFSTLQPIMSLRGRNYILTAEAIHILDYEKRSNGVFVRYDFIEKDGVKVSSDIFRDILIIYKKMVLCITLQKICVMKNLKKRLKQDFF